MQEARAEDAQESSPGFRSAHPAAPGLRTVSFATWPRRRWRGCATLAQHVVVGLREAKSSASGSPRVRNGGGSPTATAKATPVTSSGLPAAGQLPDHRHHEAGQDHENSWPELYADMISSSVSRTEAPTAQLSQRPPGGGGPWRPVGPPTVAHTGPSECQLTARHSPSTAPTRSRISPVARNTQLKTSVMRSSLDATPTPPSVRRKLRNAAADSKRKHPVIANPLAPIGRNA